MVFLETAKWLAEVRMHVMVKAIVSCRHKAGRTAPILQAWSCTAVWPGSQLSVPAGQGGGVPGDSYATV